MEDIHKISVMQCYIINIIILNIIKKKSLFNFFFLFQIMTNVLIVNLMLSSVIYIYFFTNVIIIVAHTGFVVITIGMLSDTGISCKMYVN